MNRYIKFAIFGAALALPVTANVAFADCVATHAKIKSIDTANQHLVLEDGTVVHTPGNFDFSTVKVGEEYSLVYDQTNKSGDRCELNTLTPVK